MVDVVQANPGISIAKLAEGFAMSGVAVLKHVRVLERANLLITQRHGRERRLHFNPVPIQLIHDRWTDRYSQFWAGRISDLKERIESRVAERVVKSA